MIYSTRISQHLVDIGNECKPLDVILLKMTGLNEDHADLCTIAERNEGRPLGLSGIFLRNGALRVLAIADATSVILIDFTGDKGNRSPSPTPGRDYLRDHVLGRTCGFLYAFDMAPLALGLWQSRDLRIKQAIDLQSAGPPKTRAPLATIKFATQGGVVNENNVTRAFGAFVFKPKDIATTVAVTPVVQRAWVAHYISQLAHMEERLYKVPPIDTVKLPDAVLHFLAKTTMDTFQKEDLKPTEVTRTYHTSFDDEKKQLCAKADRPQNKIRQGRNQKVLMQVSTDVEGGSFMAYAKVASASGDCAQLKTDAILSGRKVSTITLIGREDSTPVEIKKAQKILQVLQGRLSVDANPWVHKIYLGSSGEDFSWPFDWSHPPPAHIEFNPNIIPCPLNISQNKAIESMLDQTDATRVTIIQGPPGTGKTTVIASFVLAAVKAARSGIWLVAQSNIAVKNIAEKLADFNITNWRLLVSDDFYNFWHEHLYTTLLANTITSGEFSGRLSELQGCPVVLCTLSMLSSTALRNKGVFINNPLNTVVVDEASQIEIGDYVPLFMDFPTIRKVVFIGDNMQLPPHGYDSIKGLQSVFEADHLVKQDSISGRDSFIFLDTQYRMPPQIGDFISQTVYSSSNLKSKPFLKSNEFHSLAGAGPAGSCLCYFVNTPGHQKTNGKSFMNLEECKAIVKLASIFQAQGKNYRIITPYDAQRSLIEEKLKKAELEWGDKCFNVDSFQGNEEDYIIISLVRSEGLGFLEDRRRVNVMLSRCKRGMAIFTSKTYINKYAGPNKSLIGKLICHYYNNQAWIEVGELNTTTFA